MYDILVVDIDKKLDNQKIQLAATDNLCFTIINNVVELSKYVYSGKNVVTLLPINKSKTNIEFIKDYIKSVERENVVILVFAKQDDCSIQLVQLLNDQLIAKVIFEDFNEPVVEETAINATIVHGDRFAAGQTTAMRDAKILEEINFELELKNQWLEHEKTITNLFSDLQLEFEQKLFKTFSLIIEKFVIEDFVYYTATEQFDSSLQLKYSFSSFPKIEPHIFTEEDEYPATFVYYNGDNLLINDYSQEQRVGKNPHLPIEIKSSLSIPLIANDKIIGIVEFINKLNSLNNVFTKPEQSVLTGTVTDLRYIIEISLLKDQILHSKNEMQDILQNINQGILTFNSQGIINPEYSKNIENIFKGQEIVGNKFTDLLFINSKLTDGGNVDKEKQAFEKLIKYTFANPDEIEMFNDLAIKKIEKNDFHETINNIKYLELDYKLIIKNETIDKVMVIITDVTEKKIMEEKLKQTKTEHNVKMQILMEIINLNPNLFYNFLQESSGRIKVSQELFVDIISAINAGQSKIEINHLFEDLLINIHSLKGTSGFVGLAYITEKFHKYESKIIEVKDKGEYSTFQDNLHEIKRDLSYYSSLISNLLDLITGFANYHLVHSEERFYENQALIELLTPHSDKIISKYKELYNKILDKVQESTEVYKKNIISELEEKCQHTVHRLAHKLNKEVKFASNIDVNIPADYLRKLENIIVPLINNAIDHGLESVEERKEQGKSEIGKIKVSAKIELPEKKLVLSVADDGQGIDVIKIKERAQQKGIYDKNKLEKMDEDKIIKLIFIPELTTMITTTKISGRGCGMNIVDNIIKELTGKITVKTKKKKGTTFLFEIPIRNEKNKEK